MRAGKSCTSEGFGELQQEGLCLLSEEGPSQPEWRSPYRNDKKLANLVWAHGPSGQFIRLIAHPETLRLMIADGLNRTVGDYCGLIHGDVLNRTRGLLAAHALFQGLNRPCLEPGRDDEILIYVIAPESGFMYPENARHEGIGPTPWARPKDSVFVVYVDLKDAMYRTASGHQIATAGSILFWEWVLWDKSDPSLPADYRERYSRWIW